MKIRMIVATHKPYWMPEDPVYLPVQVGAAGRESLGFQRDDEGENISAKNPNYCELTGLYWAWKNLDADYIGLVHYRRYFSGAGTDKRAGSSAAEGSKKSCGKRTSSCPSRGTTGSRPTTASMSTRTTGRIWRKPGRSCWKNIRNIFPRTTGS